MKNAWLALALLTTACAPDFVDQWEVDQPRLLGARVEVEGDPERTRPGLGERFSLRFGIGLPARGWPTPLADRYGFGLSLCLGFLSDNGTLVCLGEQRFTPTVQALSDDQVLVSGLALDLSGLAQLGISAEDLMAAGGAIPGASSIDRLALFGVFCVDGTPERVADKVAGQDAPSALFRCQSRPGAAYTDATTFTLSVYFDEPSLRDGDRNPSFACDTAAPTSPCNAGTQLPNEPVVPGAFVIAKPATKGGTGPREVIPWPARDLATQGLPWDNCAADPALPQIRADSGDHTLRARFDPSDREEFQYTVPFNGVPQLRTGREALTLTHAATSGGGELSRFVSKLDSGDADQDAEISFRWTPPEKGEAADSIPVTGRLVRFYFTLRDERGGVDFATRELCLVPALRAG